MVKIKNWKKVAVAVTAVSALGVTLVVPSQTTHAYYNYKSYHNYNPYHYNFNANQNDSQTSNSTGSSSDNYVNKGTSSNQGTAGTQDQSTVTLADKIIKTGEKYLGTPYKFGAPSGQTKVFDCSSFTQYIFKQNGISLPRNSRQQSTVGTTVKKADLKKGDLIFFKTSKSGGKVGHVAVYAGNGKVLHTWGPGGVRYDNLSTKWLAQGYLFAKRVIK